MDRYTTRFAYLDVPGAASWRYHVIDLAANGDLAATSVAAYDYEEPALAEASRLNDNRRLLAAAADGDIIAAVTVLSRSLGSSIDRACAHQHIASWLADMALEHNLGTGNG